MILDALVSAVARVQPYPPEELGLLFQRLEFQLIGRWATEDVLQRGGTHWVTMLFERGGGQARAVDQIEGVLSGRRFDRAPAYDRCTQFS